MKKINYKSDFDILASLMAFDGEGKVIEVGFANYDWELNLFTGSTECANRGYKVSYIGGKCTNCFNDNGKVHIVCDNHNLNVGVLNGLISAKIPNAIYPDGHQLLVHPISFDVELVRGAGDAPTEVEVEILLPYLYDSAYRQAVIGGYQGTQEEYYALATQLPNAVETAMKIQGTADSLAESAEQIGGAIEKLGTTTDAIEQGANVIKDNADVLQASADIVKSSAEQIGGNIADLQASVSSIDSAVEGINQGASTIANSATKVESSATTLEGVSATISGSASSLSASATAIAEGATTIKNSTDALQENADKVGASASAVGQAVEPLVQASESLDATKQAFEMLSSEWSDGRQAIATALTNRKYPTEPTESFHSMAQKITDMNYEEGWFAKIGYTKENDGGIQDAIDYSYELAKGWNPDGSTMKIFTGNVNLIILPAIETKNCTTLATLCQSCSNLLFAPLIDAKSATSLNYTFGDTKLTKLNIKNTQRVSIFSNALRKTNVTKVDSFDFSSVTAMTGCFNGCSLLVFLLVVNIGKSSLTTYDFSDATSWGTGGEENRQSLIDSLITYSYDRASNGMATATITLSANTKALLTEEEIAQITSKGFTIA